jgi:hypothetical protein
VGEDESLELAESLVTELARNVKVLSTLLTNDPRSESGLTALADLALLASVLARDHPGSNPEPLADAVRYVLAVLAPRPGGASPGPEEWALHAAQVWLDADIERQRLHNRHICELVAESKWAVLALGPPWRPEEIAYVDACFTGSSLPALRAVKVDTSIISLYELTHVAFYATDFGAVPAQGPLAAQLAATAAKVAGEIASTDWGWDVGVELILAARFLSGRWPAEADVWIGTLMPERTRLAISALRGRPEQFMSLYHAMGITALALAQVAANGRTS